MTIASDAIRILALRKSAARRIEHKQATRAKMTVISQRDLTINRMSESILGRAF